MSSRSCIPGGGHGGDREVFIKMKRGVEAKNYADVRHQRDSLLSCGLNTLFLSKCAVQHCLSILYIGCL